jgi:hypothetical protein
MVKMLSAALFAAVSSAALAQTQPGLTPPDDGPIVGGPAPTVGGIESRPLRALSQCDDLIGLQRERCLQAESAARGSTAVAEGPGTQIRAGPPLTQPPAPAAERDRQRCEARPGAEKERCLKDLRAAAAADEKARGPGAVGGSTGGGTSAAGGPSVPGAPSGALSR